MKRSDAIKQLQNIVLKHVNCDPNCCSNDDEMFTKILDEIESVIGMLPPYKQGEPEWEDEA